MRTIASSSVVALPPEDRRWGNHDTSGTTRDSSSRVVGSSHVRSAELWLLQGGGSSGEGGGGRGRVTNDRGNVAVPVPVPPSPPPTVREPLNHHHYHHHHHNTNNNTNKNLTNNNKHNDRITLPVHSPKEITSHPLRGRTTGRTPSSSGSPSSPTAPQHPPPSSSSSTTTTPLPTCPIPSTYISLIRKTTFAGSDKHGNASSSSPIDLYTDVLGLPMQSHPYTDAQIRVAYFRQGRSVLQQPPPSSPSSSSPNSTILQEHETHPVPMAMMPLKQRFQAITKAYEIVTNPIYRAYYETYGLPPLKPDAPAPAPARGGATTTAVPSPRRIDPVRDDRNDTTDERRKNMDRPNNPPVPVDHEDHDDDDDDDDDDEDVGSVASFGSILRNSHRDPNRHRSKSWGPVSSSSSRQRVVWKEVVQELIYQPDPPSNHSIDIHLLDHQPPQPNDLVPTTGHRMRSDAFMSRRSQQELEQQELDDRDFLDDLEASVDGIGATIGSFVKYLSEHDVANHSIEVRNDEEQDVMDDERNHPPPPPQRPVVGVPHGKRTGSPPRTGPMVEPVRSNDWDPTSTEIDPIHSVSATPMPCRQNVDGGGGGAYAKRMADYHRRSHSHDDKLRRLDKRPSSMTTTTSTAPLKEGKTDQEPRTKPKKSKRKKKRLGVDKVPSHMTDTVNDAFDPFHTSVDESVDFGAVDPLTDSWTKPPVSTLNDCCIYDLITRTNATTTAGTKNTKLDAYELPDVSSILASLDDGETPEGIDVGAEKSLSFDDALDRTMDATTKGYIRLDRRAHSLSAVVDHPPHHRSSLNVSDLTYSSNVSDDPAGRHFHFSFLTSLTQSATATMKEIASFDDDDDEEKNRVDLARPHDSVAQHAPSPVTAHTQNRTTPTNPPNDVDIISQFSNLMQSLVEDVSNLGTQIRSTMTFPDDNLSGFLETMGSGFLFATESKEDPTAGHLPQSFTF